MGLRDPRTRGFISSKTIRRGKSTPTSETTENADEQPRPGDIAAFYDAKLKGKKGLSSYSQNVGSVEEPLVGIVSESETKKHKLRVLQVERGVSYSSMSVHRGTCADDGIGTGGGQLSM